MPTVFVSQLPHKRDPATGLWAPAYNVDPANEHGTVQILVPPRASFNNSNQLIPQLRQTFHYDFAKGDCLVLLGDPFIIAAVVSMASAKGDVRVLRWDRNLGRYIPVVVRLAA